MRRILRISIFAICLLSCFSCSKELTDAIEKAAKDSKSIVNITLKDDYGNIIDKGFTVYMFSSSTWNAFGDTPFHATSTVVANESGVAKFIIDDIFVETQQTYYFSCHYRLGETPKSSHVGVTLQAGETANKTLILN